MFQNQTKYTISNDILKCFNIKTYNFENIGKIQDEIFELYKTNKSL